MEKYSQMTNGPFECRFNCVLRLISRININLCNNNGAFTCPSHIIYDYDLLLIQRFSDKPYFGFGFIKSLPCSDTITDIIKN